MEQQTDALSRDATSFFWPRTAEFHSVWQDNQGKNDEARVYLGTGETATGNGDRLEGYSGCQDPMTTGARPETVAVVAVTESRRGAP